MATDIGFRRVLYTSIPASTDLEADRLNIIERSQRANGMDGITGALWSAPDLYIQVLEGSPDAVAETFGRIRQDLRHHSIQVLADSIVEERLFGAWAMTGLGGSSPSVVAERLRDLVLAVDDPRSARLAERLMS